MSKHEVHVKFAGRIVMVGFGSIGQGVLPLILRHIGTSADRITIVTAEDKGNKEAQEFGVKFVKNALTPENYRKALKTIPEVSLPKTDPVMGEDGPLLRLWKP